MKICISIGHGKSAKGGYDSGALGGGYEEFKIGREIGKYAAAALREYGCGVTLINYDADKSLYERIRVINAGKYDLAMEIHLNAAHGTGSEVYYKVGNNAGKKIAGAISKSIATKFGIPNRGAKVKVQNNTNYFGFVREVKCQSLLVETVFIDTASDRKHVETAAGQKQCGIAIAEAVASVYKLKKTTASAPVVTPTTPSTPTQPASAIKAGDIVKIIGKKYATGQNIPIWVKLRKHTVKSVNGNKALLKEINSWVYIADLTVTHSAPKEIGVGSIVTIRAGAVYGGLTNARGKAVPKSQLAPTKHTVSKIQVNGGVKEALLSDIFSWVAVKYLEEV